jgi:hypothetical protein
MLLFLDQFAYLCRERVRFGLVKVGGLAFDKHTLFARRAECQPAEDKAWEKNGRQKYQSVAFQGSILTYFSCVPGPFSKRYVTPFAPDLDSRFFATDVERPHPDLITEGINSRVRLPIWP